MTKSWVYILVSEWGLEFKAYMQQNNNTFKVKFQPSEFSSTSFHLCIYFECMRYIINLNIPNLIHHCITTVHYHGYTVKVSVSFFDILFPFYKEIWSLYFVQGSLVDKYKELTNIHLTRQNLQAHSTVILYFETLVWYINGLYLFDTKSFSACCLYKFTLLIQKLLLYVLNTLNNTTMSAGLILCLKRGINCKDNYQFYGLTKTKIFEIIIKYMT